MDELDSYATMMTGCHDPERLKKIIGYIDGTIKSMNTTIKNLNTLKEVAEERIKERNNGNSHLSPV